MKDGLIDPEVNSLDVWSSVGHLLKCVHEIDMDVEDDTWLDKQLEFADLNRKNRCGRLVFITW